ncbi:MAG: alpha-1,4-glucan--maltose-1-phosphate maltosyltransferase, partial [Acidimicrobiales bacterium]
GPDDPGSPWAIGSADGGHTEVDAGLGTVDDFTKLVEVLCDNGMEIALDYALQCSPDHPWVREHPEWFHVRPDGSIAYAENPPKRYQDIFPINFWPAAESDRLALWEACKEVMEVWIDRGVRIFRVDNPHTKPLAFWEWLLPAVRERCPEVIFLAEAFTRPHMMAKLAEVGFSQSYTYFTWRTRQLGFEGIWEFLEATSNGPEADYMRPNFWPNTPDILSGPLRNGPPAAFALRLVLAATSSPSYGIYSGYEIYENLPASSTNEEYLDSEKYQLKPRDYGQPGNLNGLIHRLNSTRRRHAALRRLPGLVMHPSDNPLVVAYSKTTLDGSDAVLCVVNLDPDNFQSSFLHLDLERLGLPASEPYPVYDELAGIRYEWEGDHPYIALNPPGQVAHVFDLHPGTQA